VIGRGTNCHLAEAMVAALHEEIDTGIIDVNLGGELVCPSPTCRPRGEFHSCV
jgi:hypothetical protein